MVLKKHESQLRGYFWVVNFILIIINVFLYLYHDPTAQKQFFKYMEGPSLFHTDHADPNAPERALLKFSVGENDVLMSDKEPKPIQQQTANNKNSQQQSTKIANDDQEPLNILVLYGDDWTLKTLGALNSFVKTPNLDELAKSGMLFTHNCVTTSICMVSRATLYTGQYASTHETYWPGSTEMFRDGVWNETLFPLLVANGYHTGLVGKWHHQPPPQRRVPTFHTFKSYYGTHYVERGGVTKHVTEWNEEDALEFLKNRPKDKKFALLVSFFAIHAEDFGKEQYKPQNRSMHLYAGETVPAPKTATETHFRDLP